MSVRQLLAPPATKPQPLALCYALACLLMPIVSLFNARALVPIAAVIALGALVVAWRRHDLTALASTDRWLGVLIAGYIAIQIMASLGSPDFSTSMPSVVKLVGIAAMALVLIPLQTRVTADDLQWIFIALLVSVLATAAWILLDIGTGGTLSALVFN